MLTIQVQILTIDSQILKGWDNLDKCREQMMIKMQALMLWTPKYQVVNLLQLMDLVKQMLITFNLIRAMVQIQAKMMTVHNEKVST